MLSDITKFIKDIQKDMTSDDEIINKIKKQHSSLKQYNQKQHDAIQKEMARYSKYSV